MEFTRSYIESRLTMIILVEYDKSKKAWMFLKPFTRNTSCILKFACYRGMPRFKRFIGKSRPRDLNSSKGCNGHSKATQCKFLLMVLSSTSANNAAGFIWWQNLMTKSTVATSALHSTMNADRKPLNLTNSLGFLIMQCHLWVELPQSMQ
ncbi:PREDICTED: uncharacterized protein LOC109162996 isoform X2 [Ipomoea nil]|uniref:uncharacterized protein LOC109162996 isoform X2 n=1 Tax=Ipomoea nil TaxID=35883 RepID=UPI00090165B9|nr:PREDICTED: uncharacterized protein LOC109162996 isoform X2 [Ipomoea nil]